MSAELAMQVRYFIQSILLKLVVYVLKLIFLYFCIPSIVRQFMPFVILTRRWHLDNTTFFAFPKHVILKREMSNIMSTTRQGYSNIWLRTQGIHCPSNCGWTTHSRTSVKHENEDHTGGNLQSKILKHVSSYSTKGHGHLAGCEMPCHYFFNMVLICSTVHF